MVSFHLGLMCLVECLSEAFWGPLLFLIHINDLPELFALQDVGSKIYLYADDAKIYKVINQITDQLDLQTVMNTVKTWSDEWLLRLSIDKSKAVSYCLKTLLDAQYHIIDGNMSYNLEQVAQLPQRDRASP